MLTMMINKCFNIHIQILQMFSRSFEELNYSSEILNFKNEFPFINFNPIIQYS